VLAAYALVVFINVPTDGEGDFIKSLALVWAINSAAALLLGHAIAWALRGFRSAGA
jgi:hypothetical protein